MLRIITVFLGLIGLGFLAVGMIFILGGLPQAHVITCQRLEPRVINCQYQYKVVGVRLQEAQLNRLKNAAISSAISGDVDADGKHYQLHLVGIQSSVSVADLSQADAEALVKRVNAYIASTTGEALMIQSSYRSWLHVVIGPIYSIGSMHQCGFSYPDRNQQP